MRQPWAVYPQEDLANQETRLGLSVRLLPAVGALVHLRLVFPMHPWFPKAMFPVRLQLWPRGLLQDSATDEVLLEDSMEQVEAIAKP